MDGSGPPSALESSVTHVWCWDPYLWSVGVFLNKTNRNLEQENPAFIWVSTKSCSLAEVSLLPRARQLELWHPATFYCIRPDALPVFYLFRLSKGTWPFFFFFLVWRTRRTPNSQFRGLLFIFKAFSRTIKCASPLKHSRQSTQFWLKKELCF